MQAIFKREFKAYFTSMLGYVFLTIFLLLSGIMFAVNCLFGATTSMTGYFGTMISWSSFILPILTMRMFSEDKKQKTDQLLLTAPIGIHEMVFGKYFAAVCAFLVGTAVMLLYPIVLTFYGTVPMAETISCFVGYILYSSCLIAIGAFMSSLTESQIVAAISTYGVIIVIMFLGNIAVQINSSLIANILMWISPIGRFTDFTMGVLNIESIVYYISFIAVFLFITIRVFEKKRWN